MSSLIKQTSDIQQHEGHIDAGESYKITCPNCNQSVFFADHQWWRSKCACGEWSLKLEATLEIKASE